MLYISGENDTLRKLREMEGFEGSLEAYQQQFAKLNPVICSTGSYKEKLPCYMPMYLVTVEAFDPLTKDEIVQEVSRFSFEERKALRQLQEDQNDDVVTQVTLTDILEDLQSYAHQFRAFLKTPLILSPWETLNNSLTNKHLLKLFGETSNRGSDLMSLSPFYRALDTLYEDMLAKDALCRQWHMLRYKQDKESVALKRDLKKQIDERSGRIRQQLGKRVKDRMSKYVNRRFTADEIKQMNQKIATPRKAGRMQLSTTNMDVLNRLGLGRLRKVAGGMKKLGSGLSKCARLLNWGVVAYDTAAAYQEGKNFARTFFAGATSVVVGTSVTAAVGGTTALGGIVIGALAGDVALGATILICSPVIGWAALLIGFAAAGFIAYKTKEAAEGVWDLAEGASKSVIKETSDAIDWMHDSFKTGWENQSEWIPKFYGDKK